MAILSNNRGLKISLVPRAGLFCLKCRYFCFKLLRFFHINFKGILQLSYCNLRDYISIKIKTHASLEVLLDTDKQKLTGDGYGDTLGGGPTPPSKDSFFISHLVSIDNSWLGVFSG